MEKHDKCIILMRRDYTNQLDIKDFYPSIKETLLHEAIWFAKKYVFITTENVEVIFLPRKSVLYNDGEPLLKKDCGSFADIMGAYDGAEVYERMGIYMLYVIYLVKRKIQKNIGLHRDEGLAKFKNVIELASKNNKR